MFRKICNWFKIDSLESKYVTTNQNNAAQPEETDMSCENDNFLCSDDQEEKEVAREQEQEKEQEQELEKLENSTTFPSTTPEMEISRQSLLQSQAESNMIFESQQVVRTESKYKKKYSVYRLQDLHNVENRLMRCTQIANINPTIGLSSVMYFTTNQERIFQVKFNIKSADIVRLLEITEPTPSKQKVDKFSQIDCKTYFRRRKISGTSLFNYYPMPASLVSPESPAMKEHPPEKYMCRFSIPCPEENILLECGSFKIKQSKNMDTLRLTMKDIFKGKVCTLFVEDKEKRRFVVRFKPFKSEVVELRKPYYSRRMQVKDEKVYFLTAPAPHSQTRYRYIGLPVSTYRANKDNNYVAFKYFKRTHPSTRDAEKRTRKKEDTLRQQARAITSPSKIYILSGYTAYCLIYDHKVLTEKFPDSYY